MPAAPTGPPPPGCLWLRDAALYLGLKPETLHTWRCKRKGPRSFKHGGWVVYRQTALDDYLADCEESDSHSNPALNPLLRAPEPRRGRRVATA